MPRRCPRRAELFGRPDGYREARRREPPSPPHFAKSAEASREEEESNSTPVSVYFKQRYWKWYKALTGREPNPGNSLLSYWPPPEKEQLIVSDKDDEQCDGDRLSSESVYQVLYKHEEVDDGEDEQRTNHLRIPSKQRRQRSLSIAAYVVQCATCEKWRLIPSKQKYEELRAQIQTDPFRCEKAREWKPDFTCNVPSDVSQDGSWIWAMDRHGIPQPPQGFERLIAVRAERGNRFADVYYYTPSGKKLRSSKKVENYLKENPEYAVGVNLSQFSFKIPEPARQDYIRKRGKADENDGKESSNPLVEEGQPIALSAPPMHGEPRDNNQLILYKGGLNYDSLSRRK